MAQLVKNLPAMWETWVQFLGWEDPLEKGKDTHSSIPAWRNPWRVHGVAKSRTQLSDFHYVVTKAMPALREFLLYLQRETLNRWGGAHKTM